MAPPALPISPELLAWTKGAELPHIVADAVHRSTPTAFGDADTHPEASMCAPGDSNNATGASKACEGRSRAGSGRCGWEGGA